MQTDLSTKPRNRALDGLRGFSALMVVFTHLNLDQATVSRFAPWAWYFIQPFVSGGTLYVAILFVLTGYLMSMHYAKVASWSDFMQKRYTRLFPVFICVSIFYTYFYYSVIIKGGSTDRNILLTVGILLITVLTGGLVWRLYLKYRTIFSGKAIFSIFFCLQIGVAITYVS
ncbi:MAG: acyltransferase family protein [Candidatus Roizmanbacteria bacterium]